MPTDGIPIPIVSSVSNKLSMEQVEPREMHMDYEALKGSGFYRIVIKSDCQARFLSTRAER